MINKEEFLANPDAYDVDWYLLLNDGKIAHFASSGGKIPKLALTHYSEIVILDEFIKRMPASTKVTVNPNLDKIVNLVSKTDRINYLKSFTTFSERGLLSFDRSVLDNIADTKYHLVSSPEVFLSIENLPMEVQGILSKLTFSGNFQDLNNLDFEGYV